MLTAKLSLLRSTSSNRFCVPAALGLLTGLHVDECESMIREYLGDVDIQGVYYPVTLRILRTLGYQVKEHEAKPIRLDKLINAKNKSKYWLITIRGHILASNFGLIYDNMNPSGIDPKEYKFKNAQVEQIWEISKPGESK